MGFCKLEQVIPLAGDRARVGVFAAAPAGVCTRASTDARVFATRGSRFTVNPSIFATENRRA